MIEDYQRRKTLAWVSSTWMDQSLEQGVKFQKELRKRLNSRMEEKEEAKLINFSQLLEYDLFSFLIVF